MTSRRAFIAMGAGLGLELCVRPCRSQAAEVPVRLQAELLSKVLPYDRNFTIRARGRASVRVLVKGESKESSRLGEQLLAELRALSDLGGLPHVEELLLYTSPQDVLNTCAGQSAAVLYVSTGLSAELPAIAQALEGLSILSAAILAADVLKGSVLGFAAESGHPKLLVNFKQAQRQKVAFQPEVLRLATVIT